MFIYNQEETFLKHVEHSEITILRNNLLGSEHYQNIHEQSRNILLINFVDH